MPKGDSFINYKQAVCNDEYKVVTEVPVTKPETTQPEAPKIFQPLFFLLGFLVVIGGGLFLYQKLSVSYFSLTKNRSDKRDTLSPQFSITTWNQSHSEKTETTLTSTL